MSKTQEDEVIQAKDLIAVLEAAKSLVEWPIPDDIPTSMVDDWNTLRYLVDEL